MNEFPRIYLGIDNCFASKRWTRPTEWMSVVRDLGLEYVEASADTEADPLYCGEEYLSDWVNEVETAGERTGVKVPNLYSGHGSYATLGLGHTDSRVRRRLIELWIKPMARAAHRLGSGLGFYFHAFPQKTLQNPKTYAEAVGVLFDELAEIARYASELGGLTVSLEQMYSPHQIPWTIQGTRELLEKVNGRGKAPLYVTIDTGHQTGQGRYARPSIASIEKQLQELVAGAPLHSLWLGPESAFELAKSASTAGGEPAADIVPRLTAMMDSCPHLFSRREDSDTYAWLRNLGCYSPIIHLQQVVGESSSHLPFTAQMNKKGLVDGSKLLRALADAYARPAVAGLPPRATSVHLTLEIFSATGEHPREILAKLRESVAYWRNYLPRDGMRLDELTGTDS